jgi:hypothetical protein
MIDFSRNLRIRQLLEKLLVLTRILAKFLEINDRQLSFYILLGFIFWWDWSLNSGLRVAKQVLKCMSYHFRSHFALVIGEGASQTICLGWP